MELGIHNLQTPIFRKLAKYCSEIVSPLGLLVMESEGMKKLLFYLDMEVSLKGRSPEPLGKYSGQVPSQGVKLCASY